MKKTNYGFCLKNWKKRHFWQKKFENFESIFLLRKFWFFWSFLVQKRSKKVKIFLLLYFKFLKNQKKHFILFPEKFFFPSISLIKNDVFSKFLVPAKKFSKSSLFFHSNSKVPKSTNLMFNSFGKSNLTFEKIFEKNIFFIFSLKWTIFLNLHWYKRLGLRICIDN